VPAGIEDGRNQFVGLYAVGGAVGTRKRGGAGCVVGTVVIVGGGGGAGTGDGFVTDPGIRNGPCPTGIGIPCGHADCWQPQSAPSMIPEGADAMIAGRAEKRSDMRGNIDPVSQVLQHPDRARPLVSASDIKRRRSIARSFSFVGSD
jgi:hypothetical protein